MPLLVSCQLNANFRDILNSFRNTDYPLGDKPLPENQLFPQLTQIVYLHTITVVLMFHKI